MTRERRSKPCLAIQEHFSAYLDGELPDDKARAVQSHLETCPRCRKEFETFQRLWDLLAAAPVAVPPDLPDRVLARLAPPRRRWWADLALAASFVLGIFLGGKLGLGLYEVVSREADSGPPGIELLAEAPEDSWGNLLLVNGDNGT